MVFSFGVARFSVEVFHLVVVLINLAILARVAEMSLLASSSVILAITLFAPTLLGTAFSLPLAIANENSDSIIIAQLYRQVRWSLMAALTTWLFILSFVDLSNYTFLYLLISLVLLVPLDQYLVNICEQRLMLKEFIYSRLLKSFALLLVTQYFLMNGWTELALSLGLPVALVFTIVMLLYRLGLQPNRGATNKKFPLSNSIQIIYQKAASYICNSYPQLFLSSGLGPSNVAAHANIQKLNEFASGMLDRPLSAIALQIANKKYSDDENKGNFFSNLFCLQLLTSFPVMLSFFYFSSDIFILILGERWVDYASLFTIYVFASLVNFLLPPINQFFMSIDRMSYYTFLLSGRLIATIALCIFYYVCDLSYGDLIKFLVLISLLFSFFSLMIFIKVSQVGWARYIKIIGAPVGFCGLLHLIATGIDQVFTFSHFYDRFIVIDIFIQSAIFIALYLLAVWVTSPPIRTATQDFLRAK